MIRPDTSIIFFVILGSRITSGDIAFVMSHLCQRAYKWREIGLALHFEDGELENIRHSFPTATTQQLLSKLLSQWSQWPTADHSDVPTMERLCDALRSGLVGLGAEADHLYGLRHSLPW